MLMMVQSLNLKFVSIERGTQRIKIGGIEQANEKVPTHRHVSEI